MISWSLRYCYGRGAANVPVPAPRRALEMVPSRSSRELAAALVPLSLALLLPLCAVLLGSINWMPTATHNTAHNTINNSVTVVLERTATAPASESKVDIATETPRPIEAEKVATRPEALETDESLASAPRTAQEAVLALEIDGIGAAPQIPAIAPAAPSPKLGQIEAARKAARAVDFEPVAKATAPIDIAKLEKPSSVRPGLPAVSLAGPSAGPAMQAVAAESPASFGQGLAPPTAPAIAQLPGPVGSRFHEIDFESTAVGESTALGRSNGVALVSALEGVPLETLAACSSREREDNLKQQLMHSIESGSQCTGHGGTYSFLEAKNLNAFLMRVARDEQRALGNRCDELMRAQMCVDAWRVGGRN